jgi:hypothetical protein
MDMVKEDSYGSPFERISVLMRDLIVFSILAPIMFFGFFFVRRNYKTE